MSISNAALDTPSMRAASAGVPTSRVLVKAATDGVPAIVPSIVRVSGCGIGSWRLGLLAFGGLKWLGGLWYRGLCAPVARPLSRLSFEVLGALEETSSWQTTSSS